MDKLSLTKDTDLDDYLERIIREEAEKVKNNHTKPGVHA